MLIIAAGSKNGQRSRAPKKGHSVRDGNNARNDAWWHELNPLNVWLLMYTLNPQCIIIMYYRSTTSQKIGIRYTLEVN